MIGQNSNRGLKRLYCFHYSGLVNRNVGRTKLDMCRIRVGENVGEIKRNKILKKNISLRKYLNNHIFPATFNTNESVNALKK